MGTVTSKMSRGSSRFHNPDYHARLSEATNYHRRSRANSDQGRTPTTTETSFEYSNTRQNDELSQSGPSVNGSRYATSPKSRFGRPESRYPQATQPVRGAPGGLDPRALPDLPTNLTAPGPAMKLEDDLGRVKGEVATQRMLRREMSTHSVYALETLDSLSDRLKQYEEHVASIVGRESTDEPVGKTKTRLGQLFGDVDKMLSTQVDAVCTADLNSGKLDARTLRKAITLRAQQVLDTIEKANKELDAIA